MTLRVSKANTPAAQWDRDTFPYLYDLAKNHPEAGVHFLSMAAVLSSVYYILSPVLVFQRVDVIFIYSTFDLTSLLCDLDF